MRRFFSTLFKKQGGVYTPLRVLDLDGDAGAGGLGLATPTTPGLMSAAQAGALARVSGDVATLSDADYAFAAGVSTALQTGVLTAARTVTLPSAASVGAGGSVLIADLSMSLSPLAYLAVAAAGSDTVAGGTVLYMSLPGDAIRLYSDGTSTWTTQAGLGLSRAKSASVSYAVIPGVALSGGAAASLTANYVYYSPPFELHESVTVESVISEVTVGGTAGTFYRVGIYLCNTNMQPTALVWSSGAIDVATAAIATTACGATLRPGRYMFALHSESTATFFLHRGGAMSCGISPTLTGTTKYGQMFRVSKAFAALANPGTLWDSNSHATTPGGIYPAALVLA